MLIISNYHYIRPNFKDAFPSIFGVTVEQFKNQLMSLSKIGRFIHPNDLIENAIEILSSQENYILITFDDGLREQLNHGIPILDELNIPAIFFINSINHIEGKVSLVHKIHLVRSLMSSKSLYQKLILFTKTDLTNRDKIKAHQFYRFDNKLSAELKYYLNIVLPIDKLSNFINDIFVENFNENEVLNNLYFSKKDIVNLAKMGYIGSHSHSHLPLGKYNKKVICHELQITKEYIENISNTPINHVAYPYGSKEAVTEIVAMVAKEVGYIYGFTTRKGYNTIQNNFLLLNRFDCNDFINNENLINNVNIYKRSFDK